MPRTSSDEQSAAATAAAASAGEAAAADVSPSLPTASTFSGDNVGIDFDMVDAVNVAPHRLADRLQAAAGTATANAVQPQLDTAHQAQTQANTNGVASPTQSAQTQQDQFNGQDPWNQGQGPWNQGQDQWNQDPWQQ